MRVVVGSDHRGVDLKNDILNWLEETDCNWSNLGGSDSNSEDDYPDVAFEAARMVMDDPEETRGVLICGSGAGVDMIANKMPGIRCALVFDEARARQAREHENVNMIALPADVLDTETACKIVEIFLGTPFSNEERHIRRLKKMELIEKFRYPVSLIPAVLAKNEEEYMIGVKQISPTGMLAAEWLHVDFMDGDFVDSKSISPEVIQKLRSGVSRKKEAHLMVNYPKDWIKDVILAGFDRIIFHFEVAENLMDDIEYIKGYAAHVEIGLAVNPETDLSEIEDLVEKVDLVLIMGVHPGRQGQGFILSTIGRIREFKDHHINTLVGVDGGISLDNINDVVSAGASNIVIGSHLIEGDFAENLQEFKKKIYG